MSRSRRNLFFLLCLLPTFSFLFARSLVDTSSPTADVASARQRSGSFRVVTNERARTARENTATAGRECMSRRYVALRAVNSTRGGVRAAITSSCSSSSIRYAKQSSGFIISYGGEASRDLCLRRENIFGIEVYFISFVSPFPSSFSHSLFRSLSLSSINLSISSFVPFFSFVTYISVIRGAR